MPCFSVAVDDGQPAQAPFMCRKTVPFSIAAEGDVAAVLGDGRADAGVEQFLDRHDDLGIGLVEEFAARLGRPAPLAGRHHRRARHEVLHDRAEDGRLEVLPFGLPSLVTVMKS